MPGRQENSSSYRHGFNGMEKDDELKDVGNSYNYIARMYDSRLGRFLSIDPLTSDFAFYTPYQFAGNKPIIAIDLFGMQPEYMISKTGKLTQPVISLLNAAFSYDKDAMSASTWSHYKDSKSGRVWFIITSHPTASVSGKKVYTDAEEYSASEWMGLISHEESHRQDLHRSNNFDFYARYLVEGAHKDYKDISTEKKAYKYGSDSYSVDLTDKLISFKCGVVLDILANEEMETSEKVSKMRRIGLEFRLAEIINPRLIRVNSDISNLESKMKNFTGHPDEYSVMKNQLEMYKIVKTVVEAEKEQITKELNE